MISPGIEASGVVVAEHGKFDLAPFDEFLDEDLLREFRRKVERLRQFLGVVRFRHAHRGAQRRRLHEHREAELLADQRQHLGARLLPLRPRNGDEIAHRQALLQKEPFGDVLIHAHRRAQHARSDEGQPGQFQQALHRAVFAIGAVQHGKDHVHAQRTRTPSFRAAPAPRRSARPTTSRAGPNAKLRAAFSARDRRPASGRLW